MTRYRYTVVREYVGTVEVDPDTDCPFEDDEDLRDFVEELALEDVSAGFQRDTTIVDVDVKVIE